MPKNVKRQFQRRETNRKIADLFFLSRYGIYIFMYTVYDVAMILQRYCFLDQNLLGRGSPPPIFVTYKRVDVLVISLFKNERILMK